MELIKNNMKLFKVFSIAFLIISIIIITIYFNFRQNMYKVFKYKNYTTQEGNQKTKNLYCDEVCQTLKFGGWQKFRKLLSPEFMKAKNFNDLSFKEYLMVNGYFFVNTIEHGKFKTYKNGAKTVFIVEFRINNMDNKQISIIENKPYDYYVSIENNTYEEESSKTKVSSVENIKFEITRNYKDIEQVGYEVKIINEGNDSVKFNFIEVTKIKLITSDESSYMLNNNVSSIDDDDMGKGSYTKKNMIFFVPQEMQPKIKYMSITDVVINGETKNILVPFF